VAKTETVDAPPSADTPVSAPGAPPEADTDRRGYYAELLLVSFAGLLLEISYTRAVSFKLYYYYTYLVIGLALLGIGFGGVLVTISNRLRRASTESILMWCLLLGALTIGVGYFVIAMMPLDTFTIWDYGSANSFANLALLLLLCLGLFVPYVAIGVVVSTLFGRRPERIGRLYFADLVGAGLACAIVVALLGWIGPVSTIFLAGAILAALGVRLAARRHQGGAVGLGGALAVLLALAVIVPSLLPDLRLDESKRHDFPKHTIYTKWSPIFRIDVQQATPDVRVLYHDGLIGSAIHKWDGKQSSLAKMGFDTDIRSLPFVTLGNAPKRELIIGAAGGYEVLSSLYFDVGHVDAIELNPATYHLVTDTYADYAGHLADNPRVNYVNGDGRSYLARSDGDYKLVWFPAPDSYAATNAANAGAFVLSESYLYTSNAIKDSLEHLAPGGIVATQFGERDFDNKPNRTSRYVATARDALKDLGVDDPSRHILVATSPTDLGAASVSTILVKRSPFTQDEIDRFTSKLGSVKGSVLRYAPGQPQGNSVSTIATATPSQLDTFFDDYPYDVRAISDNRPFFWHFRSFGPVLSHITDPISTSDWEDTVGERVLLLLLGIATLMAAVFLLLPFVAIRRDWSELPRKRVSFVYFAALGLGFMFFEITMIQRLTLFLGYPTYSLTVTLMSLLVFVGIGALLSSRIQPRALRSLPWLFGAIVALTAFYLFGLPEITDALLGSALAVRVAVSFVVLAPLGLCLGMFMPLGLGAVAESSRHPREYVAWGWAVNGFASVTGAVLTTMLAMTFGFNLVLGLALVAYLVAIVTLRSLLRGRGSGVLPAPA
jgi:MFS family permease